MSAIFSSYEHTVNAIFGSCNLQQIALGVRQGSNFGYHVIT